MITLKNDFPANGMSFDLEKFITSVREPSPVSVAILGLVVGIKVYNKILNASLTPEEKKMRLRRKFISRAKHPTRSKFSGKQFSKRQAFHFVV